MTQQTFSVGRKPRVVISQGNGNLTVHSWQEPAIRVETERSIAQLYQEGDTLINYWLRTGPPTMDTIHPPWACGYARK